MNLFKKQQKTWLNYFIQYIVWFFIIAILSFLLNFNNQKQTINNSVEINNLYAFAIIISKNTLVFLYIFSSVFASKLNIYAMIIVNAVHIGLLISRFMYMKYMLIILPHGIPEIIIFLLLGAFISIYIDSPKKNMKSLIIKTIILYFILLISAGVEAYITPHLVKLYL